MVAENKKESSAESATMLIELMGIKIAATIGDNCALVAKYKPIILYIIDKIKMSTIINFAFFA
jgi:hypothetical protein